MYNYILSSKEWWKPPKSKAGKIQDCVLFLLLTLNLRKSLNLLECQFPHI